MNLENKTKRNKRSKKCNKKYVGTTYRFIYTILSKCPKSLTEACTTEATAYKSNSLRFIYTQKIDFVNLRGRIRLSIPHGLSANMAPKEMLHRSLLRRNIALQ